MTTAVVPVRTQSIRGAEREFLPAALEIVETPPSPIGRLGAYCLVAVFTLATVWAWFGRVRNWGWRGREFFETLAITPHLLVSQPGRRRRC